MADKVAGALALAVMEAATGDLEVESQVTATAGKEVLLQEDPVTTQRVEAKAGAMINAPRDLERAVILERVVALGAAMTLERVAILEKAAQAPLIMAGALRTTATRDLPGDLETTATKVLLAVVGALQTMATRALEVPTRDPLVVVGALQAVVTKDPLAIAGALEATRDLLAMDGALETTATRALEALTKEAQVMAVTVAETTLVTARAADGKVVFRKCVGRVCDLMIERK
jgi:hypothetical protein